MIEIIPHVLENLPRLPYISDMTEIKENEIRLTPSAHNFVLRWGDMGGVWGVNRSVAQIHALLLLSNAPLTAEAIADALSIARSNVSTSLRDLVSWGLVRRTSVLGDRRDRFVAESDMWEMVAKIAALRKAREFDPAAAALAECLEDAKAEGPSNTEVVRRLSDLQELVSTFNDWYGQMIATPKSQLLPLLRLGAKAIDLLKPFVKEKREQSAKDA
jgi:DNA-binding transcriptional regulator GbsR (MarR family)